MNLLIPIQFFFQTDDIGSCKGDSGAYIKFNYSHSISFQQMFKKLKILKKENSKASR